METYDVDYFIKKFEAIPEERWHVGCYSDPKKTKFCALGHCRSTEGPTEESRALDDLSMNILKLSIAEINDGKISLYQQPTPKQRVLHALYDICAEQQPEPVKEIEPVKERTVYVTVDAAVRKLQKEISEN